MMEPHELLVFLFVMSFIVIVSAWLVASDPREVKP
jgi:hypothetical protein